MFLYVGKLSYQDGLHTELFLQEATKNKISQLCQSTLKGLRIRLQKEKEEPIDIDNSNDNSTPITNSINRLPIFKVNKSDIYNKEYNSLKD